MSDSKTAQTYSTVDKLVAIDAEIKKLEKRREELKQQVIAMGEGGHPGHLGAVTVALQSRRNLSKEAVAKLITEDQLESCYVTGSSIVVRITQFNKEEIAA